MSGVRDNLSGGISRCSQVSDLAVTVGFSTVGTIKANWTNPGDSKYKGVRIMYRTDYYPTSPTDGEVFYDSNDAIPVSEYVKDGFTDGTTYYLRAFAYTYKNATRIYTTTTNGALSSGTPLQVIGEQIFTSSGIFTVPAGVTAVDVFLVGGGGGGAGASWGTNSGGYGSGSGGGSGYTRTIKGLSVVPFSEHTVIVGAGGAGGAGIGYAWNAERYTTGNTGYDGSPSSFDDYVANGGTARKMTSSSEIYSSPGGGNGGSGGGAGGYYDGSGLQWGDIEGGQGGSDGSNGYNHSNNTGTTYGTHNLLTGNNGLGQGTTTRKFGEENNILYAGGGSGGTCTYGSARWGGPAPGTSGGGGAGGYGLKGETTQNGSNGTPNTGGGGGGGAGTESVSAEKPGGSGGAGGSGIVIVRWGY